MADKPVYNRKTTLKEDIKDIVKSVAQIVSPRPLRERASDVDDQVRRREGQSTDSNNRY